VSSLLCGVASMAAWLVAGLSCFLTLAMEMHMKIVIEISLDWHVALQGSR
jgi:hypothetical protein